MAWANPKKKKPATESDQYYVRNSERAIRRVIADTHGKPYLVARQALREAYPFGEKKGQPYRIWLKILGSYEDSLIAIHTSGQTG